MKEIDKVLDSNERVLWDGRPRFWPFFLSGFVPMFVFGLFWLAMLIPFFMASSFTGGVNSSVPSFVRAFSFARSLFFLPFLLVGLWLVIGAPLYKMLLFGNLFFAITNKRVIIQKGVIGRDFEYIDFDKITNADVNVGFWDRVAGGSTGSIRISSAGSMTVMRNGQAISRPYTICNVDQPYEVFKLFKKVSHDIKTDIEYPNQLRPKENPGYKSDYRSKE